jgi:hypothetical protein
MGFLKFTLLKTNEEEHITILFHLGTALFPNLSPKGRWALKVSRSDLGLLYNNPK